MTVSLAYTSLMLFNESAMEKCQRRRKRAPHPVSMVLKVVQVAG